MFNLMQSEWYQLRVRRSPKNLLLVTLVVGLLLAVLPQFIELLLNNPIDNENLTIQAEEGTTISDYTIASHIMIANSFIGGTLTFVLVILAFIAFNREYKNRTIMNPIVYGYSRTMIYLSKLVGPFTLLISYLITIFLSFTAFNLIINGGGFMEYFDLMLIEMMLPNLPYWLMYIVLFTTLLFIFENESIFIVYILLESVVSQVLLLIGQGVGWLEKVSPYLYFNLNANVDSWSHQLAMIGYSFLFMVIGIYMFQRKDIK